MDNYDVKLKTSHDRPAKEVIGQNSKFKISKTTIILMIIVALFFDLIQFILSLMVIGFVVNWSISVFAWLTFFLWFKIKGVSFANPKRAGSLLGGFLIELIPLVDMLPAWTGAIILVILSLRVKQVAEKTPGGNFTTKTIPAKA